MFYITLNENRENKCNDKNLYFELIVDCESTEKTIAPVQNHRTLLSLESDAFSIDDQIKIDYLQTNKITKLSLKMILIGLGYYYYEIYNTCNIQELTYLNFFIYFQVYY